MNVMCVCVYVRIPGYVCGLHVDVEFKAMVSLMFFLVSLSIFSRRYLVLFSYKSYPCDVQHTKCNNTIDKLIFPSRVIFQTLCTVERNSENGENRVKQLNSEQYQ